MATGRDVSQWKWVSSLMATALLTGLTSWLTFGGGVTRAESLQLIEHHAPYVADKRMIETRMESIDESVKKNSRVLDEIRTELWKRRPPE